MRELAGQAVSILGQIDGFQGFINGILLRTRQFGQQGREGSARGLLRQLQIVLNAVAFEHGWFLKLATNAQVGDFGLIPPCQVNIALE